MERWVNKTMTFEQALAEIKELYHRPSRLTHVGLFGGSFR
jgi:hypothetical protein